jgi:hypothetical protein
MSMPDPNTVHNLAVAVGGGSAVEVIKTMTLRRVGYRGCVAILPRADESVVAEHLHKVEPHRVTNGADARRRFRA